MAIVNMQIALRREDLCELVATIRTEDAIPNPLEHSHETHIQTYGLFV